MIPCTSTINILHSLGWGTLVFATVGLWMMFGTASYGKMLFEAEHAGELTKKQVQKALDASTRVSWIVSVGAGVIVFLLLL